MENVILYLLDMCSTLRVHSCYKLWHCDHALVTEDPSKVTSALVQSLKRVGILSSLQTADMLHLVEGVAVVCQFGKMAAKRPMINTFFKNIF